MNPDAPTVAAFGPTAREAAPAARVPARGVTIYGELSPPAEELLSCEALEFVAELARRFGPRREELLRARGEFRRQLLAGRSPDFLGATAPLREQEWTVAPVPPDLADRRVEITGPVDRKMIINGMNSGARVFMADFEDAHSPTWASTLQGQLNLRETVRGDLEYESPAGRSYRLAAETATLMVRPRGWHLVERHLEVDGGPVAASLFDAGLFLFHNARELLRRGSGPYLYLPKLESHQEAALWTEVFAHSEEELGIPRGSIRATVLIETLPAAFQMDEILHALRERSVGLNLGRWDFIFSFIKQFRDDPRTVLPDRARLTMASPFLAAASRLLVRTCHRRGAHAIGGMAAQLPIRDDPAATAVAYAAIAADKEREVRDGYDGTWVAHPDLVPFVRAIFDREMPGANQVARVDARSPGSPGELLEVPAGTVTAAGIRTNLRVSLRYLEAWFRGRGAVAIDHRMEDLATVEISRAQLWQWARHAVPVDGGVVTFPLLREVLGEELGQLLDEAVGDPARTESAHHAAQFLDRTLLDRDFPEFLSLRAYEELAELPEASAVTDARGGP